METLMKKAAGAHAKVRAKQRDAAGKEQSAAMHQFRIWKVLHLAGLRLTIHQLRSIT